MPEITPRAQSHRDYGPAIYPRADGYYIECDYCGTVDHYPYGDDSAVYAIAHAHQH